MEMKGVLNSGRLLFLEIPIRNAISVCATWLPKTKKSLEKKDLLPPGELAELRRHCELSSVNTNSIGIRYTLHFTIARSYLFSSSFA